MSGINYPHIASRLFNTPLLIVPAKLDAIIVGLSGRFGADLRGVEAPSKEAYTTATGERRTPGYRVVGGVGVIDIFGVLAHRTSMQADSSWVLGYESIARRLAAAVADLEVSSIVLNLDTPGGEVSGLFDLVSSIREANAKKPVYAAVSDMAASAGYAIASAAREISITRTGLAGSIGVVMRHVDFSRALDSDGITVTHIFAGARKVDGNPYEPLPNDVRARFQQEIDALYELFVSTVAENRGISKESVRGTEAAMYSGQDAIDAGLADRIETPDQLIQRLSAGQPGINRVAAAAQSTGDRLMSEENAQEQTAAATEPVAAEDQTTPATPGAIYTEEDLSGAAAQARAEERSRIQSILRSDAATGRDELAAHLAFETDMAADDAIAMLEKAPAATQERSGGFAEAMAAIGNPQVGADADHDADDAAAEAARIVKLYQG